MRHLANFFGALLWLGLAVGMGSCQQNKYDYQTVENDPLKAKIYTLPNGLKVYMSVNKEQPRIQTFIAVRVGGKNDPAETTGLAHYFEHLMFKGTEQVGTINYEQEKPLLDEIEATFEVYRQTKDEKERKDLYRRIDSLSYEASKWAVPNEYDKLMAAIGASGTNAYTSYDVTCFEEDIPSNQIENWAKIQADRFEHPVIRGFHTELETVYEEKNMSLTQDTRKMYATIMEALFPNHPYGTQTILGTQEHLKNPSITAIKKYHKQWYVPNNMAICVSGDFDPDNMVDIITKYFGQLKPSENLPVLAFKGEQPVEEPMVREVYGPEAESVMLAWRFPGAASREVEKLSLLSQLMYNGTAGLIDLDINQQQRTLGAFCGIYPLADYSMFLLGGAPLQGQSLDEVKAILLEEVAKVRNGEFDEKMLEANLNNFKLYQQHQLSNNNARADMFVQSFVNGMEWSDEVESLNRLAKLTKEDLMAFAKEYLKDSNFVVTYKRQGQDPNEKKISKPEITPIVMNRDTASAFLKELTAQEVEPIEPVFVDFDKDMSVLTAKAGIPVLYKQNETNDLFELSYVFEMGRANDRRLALAAEYLNYLGTPDKSAEDIRSSFYRLACQFYCHVGEERSTLTLTGLNENMQEALTLMEELLANAKPDEEVYHGLVDMMLKEREDGKLNQQQNFGRLMEYVVYGEDSPAKNILSAEELKGMNPTELTEVMHKLNGFEHRIKYYGPANETELLEMVNRLHLTPKKLSAVPEARKYTRQTPKETLIFMAPYEAKQIYMSQYANRNELFDKGIESKRKLYNEYFGGGMNSIVFQEMRESRSLAYSAWASFLSPNKMEDPYTMRTQIASQNDKMIDAIVTFNDIINEMPQSEAAFKLAKEALIARLRTARVTKGDVLDMFIHYQDMGEKVDNRIQLFKDLQTLTLEDIIAFQKEWVKDRTYYYGILGDKKELDMKSLRKMGKVIELSTKDIFGY